MIESKKFLGIGWTFPVSSNAEKSISVSQYEDDVKESIQIILSTSKGERVMRPDFGCNIHNLVFEVINPTTLSRIKSSIIEALKTWEPRIENIDVDFSTEQINSGILLVTVTYTIITTNSRFNLVYPFYLKEGI